MGVVSRKVVPACGNLCFLCPSLRARSRQPVKRYKKMLAEILPRNQDVEPNDRKIGKLCEYASKNPLRIPEITELLEQRCYKDLRNEHFGSAKVVLSIYRNLISSCKEQMPLFACSLLGIVRILLEQNRHDEMQILGCNTLVEFIDSQMDSTYMFNLEGLIPKFCQLAQEVGEDERALRLRSAGMQTLASMVWFMGEHSHISMDFNNVISATLDNYVDEKSSKEDGQYSSNLGAKPELPEDTSKSPSYWSRVCLSNIARLAKEATTVRRVLEPLFQKFDSENHWSPEKGLACTMLMYLQSHLEESGGNSHLLISMLIKHLDHKNVAKQPSIQIDIVNITSELAQNVKQQASVAIIGAISDLIKHLRKCMQNLAEASSSGNGTDNCNADLQCALERCISKLSNKVADVGPILDMMAVVLENISTTTIVARTTISAVHRTAEIISSIPNVLYHKKAFPEALFHQLLLAMAHPDHETRVVAHSVFSIVLMPPVLSPWSDTNKKTSRVFSKTFSVGTTQKVRSGSVSLSDENKEKIESVEGNQREEGNHISEEGLKQSKSRISHSHTCSFKRDLTGGKTEPASLRLSSHQVSLILSSIWVQSTSAENTPANFEGMAHSYNIALLFVRSKTSIHVALVRCFQLALSLRSISLDQEGGMRPSRRRSLFTLASYMLIFSARAGSFSELIPIVKSSLTDATVDPHLELVDDIRLQAVCIDSDKERAYGSQEDEVAALQSLLAIESDEMHLKDAVVSHFTTKFGKLPEEELSGLQKQLLEGFSPDDAYPLGASLFMDTPRPCSPLNQMEFSAFNEVMAAADLSDDEEEIFPQASGSQSDRKSSLSINTVDILSVNELMESVLETARKVASFPVSSAPVPYDQMKSQCEALVTGKQEKMSVLHSFKLQQEVKALEYPGENERNTKVELPEGDLMLRNKDHVRLPRDLAISISGSRELGQHSFKLPPSSPYDKFMKAAGC